ncbi:Syntaxin-7 [Lamellibrachia satsuma]|nr:Syntaxin-7 [Lamellibrachia satsuma]
MANRGSFGSSETGYSYHAGGMSSARDNSNEFTRLSQVIANNIQKITQNVAQMQRLVNQIGMRQDSVELRDKLHQVQHYSNQLAKDTSKYLKDIAHLPTSSTPSEQRQRKMQRERLMNDFSSALNNFQAAQRLAAEKEKQSVARVRAHSGFSQDPFLDDRTSDDQLVGFDRVQQPFGSSNSPFDDVVSSQAQQVVQIEEDVDMNLLQEREQAIKQLEVGQSGNE